MRKYWPAYLGFLLIFGLTAASYWFGIGAGTNELLRNIAYLAAPTFAVLGGLYTLWTYGMEDAWGCASLYLVVGLLFYLVGESLWVYYDFIAQTSPYPSVADLFYLGAYPAFVTGLWGHVKDAHVAWRKFDPALLFLFGLVAVLLAGVVMYFGVYLAFDATAENVGNIVGIAYGLADGIIVVCSLLVLLLAWEFKGGKLMHFYLTCFGAFILVMVADIGFALYNEEYVAGAAFVKSALDTLWILHYLFFGLGFFIFGMSLRRVQKHLLASR